MPDLKPETLNFKRGPWPAITCLCPTYGRFERLRDAVACFLRQDYADKRLLILNDAKVPIRLGPIDLGSLISDHCIDVINAPARFPTLGQKRQALLEAAGTPVVAHWDDDDLHLPWRLSQAVEQMRAHPEPACRSRAVAEAMARARPGEGWAACVKPTRAWFAVGPRERFSVRGPTKNVFEGLMVFRREVALKLGGYAARVSGQCVPLLEAFKRAGLLHTWTPAPRDVSYVYRWGDGVHHISGGGDNRASHDAFGAGNRDFGLGPDGRRQPLIPLFRSAIQGTQSPIAWARARLAPQFARLTRALSWR